MPAGVICSGHFARLLMPMALQSIMPRIFEEFSRQSLARITFWAELLTHRLQLGGNAVAALSSSATELFKCVIAREWPVTVPRSRWEYEIVTGIPWLGNDLTGNSYDGCGVSLRQGRGCPAGHYGYDPVRLARPIRPRPAGAARSADNDRLLPIRPQRARQDSDCRLRGGACSRFDAGESVGRPAATSSTSTHSVSGNFCAAWTSAS